jgi:hypothetical protein
MSISYERINTCPICNHEGIQRALEFLPKGGTLMRMRHPDGTEHRWAEYDSIYSIGIETRKKISPERMHCPKCKEHKIGRIGMYHPDRKKPHDVRYFIVHEKLGGVWGRGKSKVPKCRRCYIGKDEQEYRNAVLKRLHRYIRQDYGNVWEKDTIDTLPWPKKNLSVHLTKKQLEEGSRI